MKNKSEIIRSPEEIRQIITLKNLIDIKQKYLINHLFNVTNKKKDKSLKTKINIGFFAWGGIGDELLALPSLKIIKKKILILKST
jgi:hypothetical protein